MSHKVSVRVALNIEGERNRIEEMKKEIDSCAGVYKEHLKSEINNIKSLLSKAEERLDEIGKSDVDSDSNQLFEYQQEVDTVMKRVANISSSLNYGSVYDSIQKELDDKLNEVIVGNGIMAMMAISEINEANEPLNSTTLLKKIDEIRTKKLSDDKKSETISELENTIMDIEIPNESKSALLEQSDDLNSPQELMDLVAMLKSHELSFKRMNDNANKFEAALVSQGFTLSGRKNAVSEDGKLLLFIKAYKDGTKDILIQLDSSMGAEWQHGDYEHHMCKADTEAFLKELKKHMNYTAPMVIRTSSNSRPLQRAAKMKERGM